jgi:hypothetical protein
LTLSPVFRRPSTLFTLSAAVIAATCVAILRSRAFAGNPDVLAWAVTFDLVITIPLLYYIVVIRSRAAGPVTIAPVFAACATIAAIVLPRGYQQTLHDIRFLVAPLEVITIVLLVRRLSAMRHHEGSSDLYTRIDSAARHILGDNRAAGFVASEVAIIWYAFAGWNRKADVPPGTRGFTVHERSGWGSIVASIIVLIVAESIGLHLLVQLWSRTAAWIVTSLDVYGLLWLLGDYNALRLRPSLIDGDVLRIRYGLRWSVTISRDQIDSIRAPRGESDWKRRDVLKVAMIEDPRLLIVLREPVVAHGLAGFRKTVKAIAISPDDDSALTAWISDARNALDPATPESADHR